MAKIHAYLNFNGNCEEAFEFYSQVFKTPNIGMHRFGDMPEDPDFELADADKNKVLHTALMINESSMIMGSDCLEGFGQKAVPGTCTYVMLDVDTPEEAREIYTALSEGAQNIEMELAEQFFAELYASFTDKYGIGWMVHYEGSKRMG